MRYNSTRSKNEVSSAQAIAAGIAADGGLYLPQSIPELTSEEIESLKGMSYKRRAVLVLDKFLTDYGHDNVQKCVEAAYTGSFENEQPAPLYRLDDGTYMMELWHGPTCAFKDLALQLLPHLLTKAVELTGEKRETVILTATSGDTGKAALEGFCDVEGTKIVVFYPENGVSDLQKLQMQTQSGDNVFVCAVKGNFDDAQTGVKTIFGDKTMQQKLEGANKKFSSANSINWGRLAPQIVYYVSAWCDLLNKGEDLSNGFNVVVPTGNFGNILAAYYAKLMGAPINKLICASNSNRVLTDFIETGVYDRNREFYTTVSPSMDILISSNLERLLYELSGHDCERVAALQSALAKDGKYYAGEDIHAAVKELFFGGYCDEAETMKTIENTNKKYGYICDTHTAVAVNVLEKYRAQTNDKRPCVIASTASPYKFPKSVLEAVGVAEGADCFEDLEKLSQVCNLPIPAPIAQLKTKQARFTAVCEKQNMADAVLSFLQID
ncbi:MAG: threonine synthase [Clostridia bacterium]|nr:threonine synthase [Clostridia bacterium]